MRCTMFMIFTLRFLDGDDMEFVKLFHNNSRLNFTLKNESNSKLQICDIWITQLRNIFNNLLEEEEIPKDYKDSITIPIYQSEHLVFARRFETYIKFVDGFYKKMT